MNAKRWTLGVVLAAALSLIGLIRADASPFSTYILSDDLGNTVNGAAPEQGDWETDPNSNSNDDADPDDGSSTDNRGNDNNGHGNNEDGVDSSNPGQGNGGPNGAVDESCDGTGECIDDEIKSGSSSTDSGSDSTTSSSRKGKKK